MVEKKTVSVDVTPEVAPKKVEAKIPKDIQELYDSLLANNDPGVYYSGEWCMDTLKKEIRKA